MTALLFVEALDAAAAIWQALLVWIAVGATMATLLLLGTLALLAWAGRRAWRAATRRSTGPSWRRGRLRARIHAARRTRVARRRTADPEYQEAA